MRTMISYAIQNVTTPHFFLIDLFAKKHNFFRSFFINFGFPIRFRFYFTHFSVVATIGRQKTLAELEKELEEIDLQSAAEQAETDKIAEEQQQVVESYEANILELQTEIDAEEAEIAQIVSKTMNKKNRQLSWNKKESIKKITVLFELQTF